MLLPHQPSHQCGGTAAPLTGAPAGWPCCPGCPPALSLAPPTPPPGLASASQPYSLQPVLSPGPPAGLRCDPPAPGSSSGHCSSEQSHRQAGQGQVTRIRPWGPRPLLSHTCPTLFSDTNQSCSGYQTMLHPHTAPRHSGSLPVTLGCLEIYIRHEAFQGLT